MVRMMSLLLVVAGLVAQPHGAGANPCWGLRPPVEGPVVREFEPVGRFSGHWGLDWAVPSGTEVRPAGPGVVTFAGTVVSNQTVTVSHGGGLRTSYSYLSAVSVQRGDAVGSSTILGRSGEAHGAAALHFSVRVDGTYVNPHVFFRCSTNPASGLRLIPAREGR